MKYDREIILAFLDGKDLEMLNINKWTKIPTSYLLSDIILMTEEDWKFRIASEPKLRPWTIDEIELDHWYRNKGVKNGIVKITNMHEREMIENRKGVWRPVVVFAVSSGVVPIWTLPTLLTCWEHSLDGRTNWQPCGVTE